MHVEYANYIEEPLVPYRKNIFQKLIQQISGGDVCDLGSHAVGHYWALGYAERVNTFSFYDFSDDALVMQQEAIDMLSPMEIQERYGDTLEFLRISGMVSEDSEITALAIQEKFEGTKQFNFLEDDPSEQFNWVIAFESLEIVKTPDEYIQSFKTARKLLREDTGKLLSVVVPYLNHDKDVECLCNNGLEGLLNPDLDETRSAIDQAGFKDFNLEIVKTHMENYPDAYFITANS